MVTPSLPSSSLRRRVPTRRALSGRTVVRAASACLLAGLFLPAAGCVKEQVPDPNRGQMFVKTSGFATQRRGSANGLLPAEDVAGSGKPEVPLVDVSGEVKSPRNALDTLAPTDAKLQDLGGLLLMYYGLKKTLPARLEDLAPLADFDQPLDLRSPESGEPYVYVRQTLSAALSGQKLVAYAPTPGKDGRRAALMMSLVTTARGTTPTAAPTRLTEAELRKNLPYSAEPAAGPGAANDGLPVGGSASDAR